MNVEERLHRVLRVTDATLAHMDLDELLSELLLRLREMLSADTAAVLLLDESRSHLVATAAKGIEEEVDQGVRIPVGRGFAGRVAAEKRPVIIEEVDHTKVLNPILRHKGIRSLLGVPLISQGDVIGVLHIGTLRFREFTNEDIELLQLVGDRLAVSIEAQLSEAERVAAKVLQRSLVPSNLPDVPDLEMAARYVPGGRGSVGGDWYDVFTLPDGLVCVAMGDVVGHGLRAAAVMGRVRSCLRAYALDGGDPGIVLEQVDRQLRHFEPGQMATVVYGRFDPSLERIHLSSAGHPPAILAAPGATPRPLDTPVDPPLGVPASRPRQSTSAELPVGGLLCFYTDGLIERRDASIDDGLDALCRTLRVGEPTQECAAVMEVLVGSNPPDDDIALLMMKRRASADTLGTLRDSDVSTGFDLPVQASGDAQIPHTAGSRPLATGRQTISRGPADANRAAASDVECPSGSRSRKSVPAGVQDSISRHGLRSSSKRRCAQRRQAAFGLFCTPFPVSADRGCRCTVASKPVLRIPFAIDRSMAHPSADRTRRGTL